MNELDEHRHKIGNVIAALQNDCDRDVRYLVSQLPGATDVTSDKGDSACSLIFIYSVSYLLKVLMKEAVYSVYLNHLVK